MNGNIDDVTAIISKLNAKAHDLRIDKDPMMQKLRSQQIIMEAKKLIWQLQDPLDAILEHTINAYTIGAMTALLDMGVFEAVPMTGTASLSDIAKECKADENLIVRLMRQLLCVNIFSEVSPNVYAHNKASIGVSKHVGLSGKYVFKVCQEEMVPAMTQFYAYLRKYGRKDINTYTETPHSWVNNMAGKNFWEVLSSDPERIDTFSRGLSLFSAMFPVVAIFPYEDKLQPTNVAERPFVVDIGGGRGAALLDFRKQLPNLKGKLILQDRAEIVDAIAPEDLPGVTKMAHDFFTEQPVKNAQIYYIRRVMHDWQDAEAAQILKAIKPAMGPDSRIIVSDMCLPNPVTIQDSHAVWLDLMMMSIGGKERTQQDWVKLGQLSGMRLVKVWQDHERHGPLAMVEYMLPVAEVVGK